ncbi:glycosyltransferase [Ramlibacter tataouinensis]|uniref:glycosyltransferase n=1 Tax=Ramlibacter tataouinensis TaxID=94132 RepID=UPI0022F3FDAF|nr:glycosyltransferase [Ramlibacter tataouinensis]WBY00729.1 glycosyltransferase [Ramlibacter tataouinensis]
MKRALVLSFSPIRSDPRVMRQVEALRGSFELTVAGFGDKPAGDFAFHDIGAAPAHLAAKACKAALLFTGLHEAYYWRMTYVRNTLAALRGEQFDLVVANDVVALPVALKVAAGAPVLLDAHEYSPKEFEDMWRWRVFFARFYTHLCRRYLPRTSAMTTVCEGIAQEYAQFGVAPRVVLNCPAQQALPVRPVDPARIRLVHHGVTIRSRKLELMIEMMQHLDSRYTLDLMLVNSNAAYMRELRQLAADDARITFREPVPMQQIAATINEYDIGVFLLPPVNFNYRLALPNKFFEFVQARLAVAIGPSPEMARLVKRYGFGIVSESFDARDLAARIAALQPADIERLKERSDLASAELNAARAGEIFNAEVMRLAAA